MQLVGKPELEKLSRRAMIGLVARLARRLQPLCHPRKDDPGADVILRVLNDAISAGETYASGKQTSAITSELAGEYAVKLRDHPLASLGSVAGYLMAPGLGNMVGNVAGRVALAVAAAESGDAEK